MLCDVNVSEACLTMGQINWKAALETPTISCPSYDLLLPSFPCESRHTSRFWSKREHSNSVMSFDNDRHFT